MFVTLSRVYRYDEARPGYHNVGFLTTLEHAQGAETLDYDLMGDKRRSVRTIFGNNYELTWQYDKSRRIVQTRYPDGTEVLHRYNAMSNLEAADNDAEPANGTLATFADYNAAAQYGSVVYGNGVSTVLSFTPQTLLLKSLQTTQGGVTLQDFQYGFDQFGNLTELIQGAVGGGQSTVQPGTVQFQYDSLDRLRGASTTNAGAQSTYARNYQYDRLGNVLNKSDVGTYVYDPAYPHRLASVTGAAPDERTLEYDANGNVVEIVNRAQSQAYNSEIGGRVFVPVNPNDPAAVEPPTGIVKISGLPVGSVQFELETSGQNNPAFRLWKWTWTPPASPDPFFQPNVDYVVTTEFTPFGGGAPIPGPALTVSDTKVIDYNSENYPIAVTWRGRTTRFFYDAANERIAKTVSNLADVVVKNRFLADGTTGHSAIPAVKSTVYVGNLYEVRDGKRYRHVYGGNKKIATVEATDTAETTVYYHPDHLGSSSVITDDSGNRAEYLSYYPFGDDLYRIDDKPDVHDVRHTFTGQEKDEETGLMNYGARMYDPELGRFMTADTLVPDVMAPQNFNRYAYVLNNPIKYTDPTGHAPENPVRTLEARYGGPPVSRKDAIQTAEWKRRPMGLTSSIPALRLCSTISAAGMLLPGGKSLVPPQIREGAKLLAGEASKLVVGGTHAYVNDMAFGRPNATLRASGSHTPEDPEAGFSMNLGAAIGHTAATVQGLRELKTGLALGTGGAGLTATGIGAPGGALAVGAGAVVTAHSGTVMWNGIQGVIQSIQSLGMAMSSGEGSGGGGSQRTSTNQMQKQVEKKAPGTREVDRVDKGHVPDQKDHVHYKDGTSSTVDGNIHDAHKGVPNPGNKTRKWLEKNGWKPPPKKD